METPKVSVVLVDDSTDVRTLVRMRLEACGAFDVVGEAEDGQSALQAVEAGLPIVTREGRFMRGRLASGILTRMGLRELVAASNAEYVALAVRLAREEKHRDALRARLARERAVLFEDTAPIRALEAFLARAARG